MVELDKLIVRKFGIKYTKDNLPWMSSHTDRTTLAELFNEAGFKKGAEIGVRMGRYSKILCEKIPGLELYSIDPWIAYGNKYTAERQEIYYQEALKNLAPFNAKIIRKSSMDALADFPDKSLDFVHIDGGHTFDNVAPDLIFWAKKVKKGGIVSLHDYYHFHMSGVVEAVDAYTKCHCINPWYVTKNLEPTAFWVNP